MPRGNQLARQWQLLQLIDSPAGIAVDDAAGKLDCTVRTIWRDLQVLQKAGFPVYDDKGGDGRRSIWKLQEDFIDQCITNRHHGHKKAGNSEAVIKDRRSAGRFRAFFVIRHSAAMSSSRLSGRPLASVALKWVQTNSSGFRSGA
jgi:hypothetical protein